MKRPVGTGLWPPLPRSSPAVGSGDDGKTEEDVDDDDGGAGSTGNNPSLLAISGFLYALNIVSMVVSDDDDAVGAVRGSTGETGDVREVSPELRLFCGAESEVTVGGITVLVTWLEEADE